MMDFSHSLASTNSSESDSRARRFTRRALLAGSLAGAAVAALGEPSSAQGTQHPARVPTTQHDWLDILAQHRGTVSLEVTTVDGLRFSHRADRAQQSASTIKVFHLAAYAQAIASGRLKPDQRVPVQQWERWYFPSDGGAHIKALKRLGIPTQGNSAVAVAKNPRTTVKLDEIVSAMIQESDNAAADFLREIIGPRTLQHVVKRLGATHTLTPSLLGANLQATHAFLGRQDPTALAHRYLTDSAFTRSMLDMKKWSDYSTQARYFATHGPRTSASDLSTVYQRVATGNIVDAETMRRHLEWTTRKDTVRIGFKGGNLPGMLGAGIEQRGPGARRPASASLLVSGLDQNTATATNPDWFKILVKAMNNSAYARHVQARLRHA